jgi:hypothetical protein
MVTQVEIAQHCGLDISSCNKILNKAPGPVFKKETVAMVFRVARQLGYRMERPTKGWALAILRELFPDGSISDEAIARDRNLEPRRVREIRKVLYGE